MHLIAPLSLAVGKRMAKDTGICQRVDRVIDSLAVHVHLNRIRSRHTDRLQFIEPEIVQETRYVFERKCYRFL